MWQLKETTEPQPTLGDKLGIPIRESPLLHKLAEHGLTTTKELAAAAIGRGCYHYSAFAGGLQKDAPAITNEELAIALLSPCHLYEPQLIRIGSQLLSYPECDAEMLLKLAIEEQCASVLKHIAECGHKTEPELPFWKKLLEPLQEWKSSSEYTNIHISRFRSETGIVNPKTPDFPKIIWLRPSRNLRKQPNNDNGS
jgi:hypothetical protein